jgi:hypothetical protein
LKPESLNSLVIAKNLLDRARAMALSSDPHLCSAGLVILQDSVELIILASLIELEIDEQQALDNLSFDQMIGELKKNKIKIPKSGTIKAMNKERVIIKHYGQLSEPATSQNYLSACEYCIAEIMRQVFGRTIEEIWLHEFISNEETKECFSKAIEYMKSGDRFEALVEIRKALFIEIESDYSIFGWKDTTQEAKNNLGLLTTIWRGGQKAHSWTKNKEWIDKNVKEPFDYIQLDHQELRNDLLEWGVITQDFWNLWRLTPSVFREKKGDDWLVKKEAKYYMEGSDEKNVKYCLDKAIHLIVKKRSHFDLIKSLDGAPRDDFVIITTGNPTLVYEKATIKSAIRHELDLGINLSVSSVVRGLDSEEMFVNVFQMVEQIQKYVTGYIRLEDTKVIKE